MPFITRLMEFKRRISPTCRDAARAISESRDVRLGYLDRVGLALHLMLCGPCARYRRSLIFLKKVMTRFAEFQLAGTEHAMPPATIERITVHLKAYAP